MTHEKISIIFPVFGTFDPVRLQLAVQSARLQDYSDLEIIISEQNNRPTCATLARKLGVSYIHAKPKHAENPYNVSRVRNNGVRASHGRYLYLNDSDIIFLRRSYLSDLYKLLKKNKSSYLLFPPMKRLDISHFRSFVTGALRKGLEKAMDELSFPDGHTTYSGTSDAVKVMRYGYGNKKYTILTSLLNNISKEELEKYGYGLLSFTYHAGGMLVPRKAFLQVGGYCEEYLGWGYDDVDLQVKLSRYSKKKRMSIPKTKRYEVLHLDHKKNLDKVRYDRNKGIFEHRMKQDIRTLISHDKQRNGI